MTEDTVWDFGFCHNVLQLELFSDVFLIELMELYLMYQQPVK